MLRMVKNEELPALLEGWYASFDDADEVVAFEQDGNVRALVGVELGNDASLSMRLSYRDEGDNVDFINAFLPFAREHYAGKKLLFRIDAEDQPMMEALRNNGFAVDAIKRHWLGSPEDTFDEEEEEDEHVHSFRQEDVMFFIYRVKDDVEAVLTCDMEFYDDELGAANARSVCFRNGFDEDIYYALFHALMRELWECACADLFVDDVPREGEAVLEKLGLKHWMDILCCSVHL